MKKLFFLLTLAAFAAFTKDVLPSLATLTGIEDAPMTEPLCQKVVE